MTYQGNEPLLFFTESQAALMTAALNQIIPADEKYPAAGDLDVVAHIDRSVVKQVTLRRLFLEGLYLLEQRAVAWYGANFTVLDSDQQIEVLRYVEKESAEFFSALVKHTYNGYYTNKKVLELCGASTVPPQPTGHVVEMGDLSSLEAVKARGKLYRDV